MASTKLPFRSVRKISSWLVVIRLIGTVLLSLSLSSRPVVERALQQAVHLDRAGREEDENGVDETGDVAGHAGFVDENGPVESLLSAGHVLGRNRVRRHIATYGRLQRQRQLGDAVVQTQHRDGEHGTLLQQPLAVDDYLGRRRVRVDGADVDLQAELADYQVIDARANVPHRGRVGLDGHVDGLHGPLLVLILGELDDQVGRRRR
jgi:hypothetical protein